jgi:hypothetical protein
MPRPPRVVRLLLRNRRILTAAALGFGRSRLCDRGGLLGRLHCGSLGEGLLKLRIIVLVRALVIERLGDDLRAIAVAPVCLSVQVG